MKTQPVFRCLVWKRAIQCYHKISGFCSQLSSLWSRAGCRQVRAGRSPWRADWGWGKAARGTEQHRQEDVPTQGHLKSHQRLLLMLKKRRENGYKIPFLVVPFINCSVRQFLWARQENFDPEAADYTEGYHCYFSLTHFPSPMFTAKSCVFSVPGTFRNRMVTVIAVAHNGV